MEFTYEEYKRMIEAVLKSGYSICSYDDIYSCDRGIILRHDVDFDLEKTLEIANIEREMGVSSTYFILLATDFYNIFSKKSDEIVKQLLAMGHKIGLHFDEQRYNAETIEEMKKYVIMEASILEKVLRRKVSTVSMHRPSKFTLDSDISFDSLINSYSSYFFKEMKYVSDSRMHWREDVFKVIQSGEYDKIHILTHPFWYNDKTEDTKEKLMGFINRAKKNRYNSMNDNFRELEEYIINEDFVNI